MALQEMTLYSLRYYGMVKLVFYSGNSMYRRYFSKTKYIDPHVRQVLLIQPFRGILQVYLSELQTNKKKICWN